MAGSFEIQVTREIFTTVSDSQSSTSMEDTRSTIAAGPAPSFPPPAHCRRSSIPIIPPPSSSPPAYESGLYPAAHGSLDMSALDSDDDNGNHSAPPPPPDYTKFIEITRAERCFYYGFLFFPIWMFGFLHFWPTFSRTPLTHPLKEAELPTWIDSSSGIAIYSSGPSSLPSSPSQKTFSWRRSNSTSSSPQSHSHSQGRPSCRILMMNRPDAYGAWRKEERAWALRCGYAMAATWAIIVMVIFVCVQTGVFGISFN